MNNPLGAGSALPEFGLAAAHPEVRSPNAVAVARITAPADAWLSARWWWLVVTLGLALLAW
ncbi:MAG: hypothetical protein KDI51_16810, partial [Xanthomonadales bacterium]|nr:hypothetical protein [Xanthomonadales bacterium]